MEGNHDVNYSLILAVRDGKLQKVKELINSFGLSYSSEWDKGYALLCDALKNKHVAVVKLLLTSGAIVNSQNTNATPSGTPLHLAAIIGDIDLVEALLEKGANINARNKFYQTPLHCAIHNKKIHVAELLLKNKADVNLKDEFGTSPLCFASKRCFQIVQKILEHGADAKYVSTSELINGYAPLHYAVRNGSKEVTKLLLCEGVHVDIAGRDNETPLHIAAIEGYEHIAEVLLANGACVHSTTLKEGYTPLHFASYRGHEEMVKLLLTKGSDISASTNDNLTPLDLSVKKGNNKICMILLQNGASVNAKRDDGITALHCAASNNYHEVVKVLLAFGAEVDCKRTMDDVTPFHFATLSVNEEICKTLLKNGANVNATTKNNATSLFWATGSGCNELVKLLVSYGANVNSETIVGSPLHTAAEIGSEEICTTLLKNGANVNAKRRDGTTALYMAKENCRNEVIKVLLAFGAKVDDNAEKSVFLGECEKEIEKIRNEIINNTNISLYDIITKNTHSLAVCMKSRNIVLKTGHQTKFPIYASMIDRCLKNVMERKELLCKHGNKIFYFLDTQLPKCIGEILSYLSNQDLRSLMDA